MVQASWAAFRVETATADFPDTVKSIQADVSMVGGGGSKYSISRRVTTLQVTRLP